MLNIVADVSHTCILFDLILYLLLFLHRLRTAQLGTRPEKLRIQKWYTVYKDHITLEDYEIHDGMGLEL